jgi:hypothetical protein
MNIICPKKVTFALKRPRMAEFPSDVSKQLQKEFIQMTFYSSKIKEKEETTTDDFSFVLFSLQKELKKRQRERVIWSSSPSCHHLPKKTCINHCSSQKEFFMHEMTSKWNLLA